MYKILKSILEGLHSLSDKVKITNHNCIVYVPSSIEIYMTGNETKFVRGGEIIGTGDDLDDKELEIIYSIRGVINPHDKIMTRRDNMVDLFNSKETTAAPKENTTKSDYPIKEDVESFEL